MNNSASEALSEFWRNKNDRHLREILRNSSLFNTSFVFAEIISTHFFFNFLSASQSIVYCNTVKTFSTQRFSSKKASHWRISECNKYFFARNAKNCWIYTLRKLSNFPQICTLTTEVFRIFWKFGYNLVALAVQAWCNLLYRFAKGVYVRNELMDDRKW